MFSENREAYNRKYNNEPLFKEKKKKYRPGKWDDIPAIAIENEHGLNIFESVDSLISAYERVIQNSRNTFKYNDEAILMVTGYQPENEMIIQDNDGNDILNPARLLEDEQVLTSRVRYLGEGGNLAWILKDVNDSALQNHKKTLMDLICLLSFIPNMTDLGFTQADNNSALEKKFFSLQQLITDAESDFKKAFTRRWELIFNKFNKDKNKEYDFRNVETTLLRNMPSDQSSETSRALSLRDLLSDETVIGLLPDDLDPKNEIAKKKTEAETNLEDNQELMKKFSLNKENNEENDDDGRERTTKDNDEENDKKQNKEITAGEMIKGSNEKNNKSPIDNLNKLKK